MPATAVYAKCISRLPFMSVTMQLFFIGSKAIAYVDKELLHQFDTWIVKCFFLQELSRKVLQSMQVLYRNTLRSLFS